MNKKSWSRIGGAALVVGLLMTASDNDDVNTISPGYNQKVEGFNAVK